MADRHSGEPAAKREETFNGEIHAALKGPTVITSSSIFVLLSVEITLRTGTVQLVCFSLTNYLIILRALVKNQGGAPYNAHSSLHGDGDCLRPFGTGARLHCCHHPSVERRTGKSGHGSVGVAPSVGSEGSGHRGQVWVGGVAALTALRRTLGELPPGGALGAEAVLARGRSLSERPEGSPGTRFDPDLVVPVRHWHRSSVHRGAVLDGYTSERCSSHRWTPGDDWRAAEPDCPWGVHTQPCKTGVGRSESGDQ